MEAYEATRQRHIEHLLPQLGEHFERVEWSSERLRAERTARLRELIEVAVQRSSWHRERLGDVDLTTLDADHLRDLPTMTKDDLMGNFDAIVTDPEVRLVDANAHIAGLDGDAYFRDELHAVASGGSSGVRGVFVWGWDAWATVQLTAMRRSLLDRIGDPELASQGGDSLATYPSMLARLVGEARAGRLRIQPRRIMTMAEPLLAETREAAEATWR